MNGVLLATCLLWCLTEVFTYRQGASSWRIHLQGIRALLDGDGVRRGGFTAPPGTLQTAMKHLYQLYLSLRTLPYIPASASQEALEPAAPPPLPPLAPPISDATNPQTPAIDTTTPTPSIDGFLGYSAELLDMIHQIDHLSMSVSSRTTTSPAFNTNMNTNVNNSMNNNNNNSNMIHEADLLLGKMLAMIRRDARAPPAVASIGAPLPAPQRRAFALCHRIFQLATLLHLYRRLYRLPSGSPAVQAAARGMREMLEGLPGGGGGSDSAAATTTTTTTTAWVAMAMPLFNLGCEAVTDEQRAFVLDKVGLLERCICSSAHVGGIRQALRDVWDMRASMGDDGGELCAGELLGE
ncbi:hypothetical protein VTK26DRAFT_8015 [Humicola hyalothermophila]